MLWPRTEQKITRVSEPNVPSSSTPCDDASGEENKDGSVATDEDKAVARASGEAGYLDAISEGIDGLTRKLSDSLDTLKSFLSDAGSSSTDLFSSLKPSELKKVRIEGSKGRSKGARQTTGGGGALDVLNEIKSLRATLREDESSAAERRAEQLQREKRQKLLGLALEEILQTEANYLADMSYCCDHLMAPLSAVLDHETHSRLFANLGQINMMHSQAEAERASRAIAKTPA